jgi:transcription termination factor Rho
MGSLVDTDLQAKVDVPAEFKLKKLWMRLNQEMNLQCQKKVGKIIKFNKSAYERKKIVLKG